MGRKGGAGFRWGRVLPFACRLLSTDTSLLISMNSGFGPVPIRNEKLSNGVKSAAQNGSEPPKPMQGIG
jgi:hypothetical protein